MTAIKINIKLFLFLIIVAFSHVHHTDAATSADHDAFVSFCLQKHKKKVSSSLELLKNHSKQKDCHKLAADLWSRDYLWLPSMGLEDISFLKFLTHLKRLDLSDNLIKSVESLSKLEQLEELWLGENNITDIDALGKLYNLKLLIIEDNNIRDISSLDELYKLIALDASRNHIEDMTVLSNLPNLSILYISHNNINRIQILQILDPFKVYYSEEINKYQIWNQRQLFPREKHGLQTLAFNQWIDEAYIWADSLKTLDWTNNPISLSSWEGGFSRTFRDIDGNVF